MIFDMESPSLVLVQFVCNQGRNYGQFGQFLRLKMDKIDAVDAKIRYGHP